MDSDLEVVRREAQMLTDGAYFKETRAIARLVLVMLADIPDGMVSIWDDDIARCAKEIRGE